MDTLLLVHFSISMWCIFHLVFTLREKFMAEGFEESLVREELDKLGLRVSYKEGHAAITLRYPE